jgi:hypothetical protein
VRLSIGVGENDAMNVGVGATLCFWQPMEQTQATSASSQIKRGVIFFAERRLSPAPTCFWHPRLLRSRRAKSAEGMGVRWTALFGRFVLSHFKAETLLHAIIFNSGFQEEQIYLATLRLQLQQLPQFLVSSK